MVAITIELSILEYSISLCISQLISRIMEKNMSHTPIARFPIMTEKAPYRLQVFLSKERRAELRAAAHEEYTSVQKLVERILGEYLDARKLPGAKKKRRTAESN